MTLTKTVEKEILNKILSTDWLELPGEGLLHGKLGLVYFYFSLYKDTKKEIYKDKIEDILAWLFQKIQEGNTNILLRMDLGDGLSGLGYILNLLVAEDMIENEFLEQLTSINELALAECLRLLDSNNFDFINGPIGILHYFVSISHDENIDLIVKKLYKQFRLCGQTFYNNTSYLEGIHLGYAHGLNAIIKTLNELDNNLLATEMISSLLNDLKILIWASNVELESTRYFLPRSIHKGEDSKYSLNWRAALAWSNSDLNYSTLVFSLKEKHVDQEVLSIAKQIAYDSLTRRTSIQTRIRDYRFFYGSSGVAQMYAKIYRFTKDENMYDGYRFWIEESARFYRGHETIKEHPLDLLNNLPGLYLVIAEYNKSIYNHWDKMLLL